MSKKETPNFLKNFFSIKEILGNEKKVKIFTNTFEKCLKNSLDQNSLNNILNKIKAIGNIDVGIYIEKNIDVGRNSGVANNFQKCYEDSVIYGQSPVIKDNYVYYKLLSTNNNEGNAISNFCEKKKKKFSHFVGKYFFFQFKNR